MSVVASSINNHAGQNCLACLACLASCPLVVHAHLSPSGGSLVVLMPGRVACPCPRPSPSPMHALHGPNSSFSLPHPRVSSSSPSPSLLLLFSPSLPIHAAFLRRPFSPFLFLSLCLCLSVRLVVPFLPRPSYTYTYRHPATKTPFSSFPSLPYLPYLPPPLPLQPPPHYNLNSHHNLDHHHCSLRTARRPSTPPLRLLRPVPLFPSRGNSLRLALHPNTPPAKPPWRCLAASSTLSTPYTTHARARPFASCCCQPAEVVVSPPNSSPPVVSVGISSRHCYVAQTLHCLGAAGPQIVVPRGRA